jgi:hypothetical protein
LLLRRSTRDEERNTCVTRRPGDHVTRQEHVERVLPEAGQLSQPVSLVPELCDHLVFVLQRDYALAETVVFRTQFPGVDKIIFSPVDRFEKEGAYILPGRQLAVFGPGEHEHRKGYRGRENRFLEMSVKKE